MTITTPIDYACLWLGRSTVVLCIIVALCVAVRLFADYVNDCLDRRRAYWQRRADVATVHAVAEQFTCPKRITAEEQARLDAAIEAETQRGSGSTACKPSALNTKPGFRYLRSLTGRRCLPATETRMTWCAVCAGCSGRTTDAPHP